MADDLTSRAKGSASAFLVALGALFIAAAPVFGLTYTQPDMGLLVIIVVVPFLWISGVVVGCLAVALHIGRWQRTAGVVLLSAAAAEVVTLIAYFVVNIASR